MAQLLQDSLAAMAVVPQRGAYVRRATKADLPAISKIIMNLVDDDGKTEFSSPRSRLIESLTLPNEALVVVEMDRYVTGSPKPNHPTPAKVVVGYARGWIVLAPGHKTATQGMWNAGGWKSGSYKNHGYLPTYLPILYRGAAVRTLTKICA